MRDCARNLTIHTFRNMIKYTKQCCQKIRKIGFIIQQKTAFYKVQKTEFFSHIIHQKTNE